MATNDNFEAYRVMQAQGMLGTCGQAATQGAMDQAAQQRGMQGHWYAERAVWPSVETLARALFETDPDVVKFVDGVADTWDRHRGETIADQGARYRRARSIAWDRDEHGWRTRATHRAERVLVYIEDEDEADQPNGPAPKGDE